MDLFICPFQYLDTAPLYKNEPVLAAFLRDLPQYGLQRKDVFVASKVPPIDHGSAKSRSSALGILERLNIDKLDLLLLHWPGVQGMKPSDPKQAELRKESWLELERLYKEAVIPKSTKAERIEENSKLFDFSLSEDQIASISGLNQNKHYCWDPTAIV
ncbi:hypothetical protein HPB47_001609 [Ixodes persulcatus]|uniref:Uncharacterized protein n=1 Tax=Ixodes persulcatus TaxID=34615 RepID=A0AC60PNQ3_IXOPE|nr:hypothetical protein HPB47_001609 [Ixodes persulcatus]